MNKKSIAVGIVVLVILAAGAGVLVWKKNQIKKQEIAKVRQEKIQEVPTENKSIPETKTGIINEIYDNYFKNTEGSHIDNNGRCFPWEVSNGKFFGLQSVEIRTIKKNEQYAVDMNTKLINYFEGKQFKKVGSEEIVYTTSKRLKFEKDELKCSIEWSKASVDDLNSFVYEVLCAENNKKDEENYNAFNPLLNKKNNNLFICVEKNDGSYARGSYGSINGGGAIWYARKKVGKWEIAFVSQDGPYCSKVGDFPLEILGGTCFDDK